MRNRDTGKALAYLNKIDPSSFAAADKYHMTGDFFNKQKNYDKAIHAYTQSLEINYGQKKVWDKLILLKKQHDRRDLLKLIHEYNYVSSFYQR